MLDVGRLATLRAVIAHGSFSAAGDALSLSQPAVSRQVALLERQVGVPLVSRTRRGVLPTEAGRLLAGHADAILGRLALAEEQLAELQGLRRGEVRLGSFFTALVHLSAELGARLEERGIGIVIRDELVDRAAAFRGLDSGEIDVAIVYEHDFEPDPPPEEIELVHMFDDPARVLLPPRHRLAKRRAVALEDLADETWIRVHEGSAGRMVDEALRRAGIDPPQLRAGRGDEPVEVQPLVAAGRGVTLAHELNVILDGANVAIRPVAAHAPVRRVQAAILRAQQAAAPREVLATLERLGRARARRRT